MIIIANSYGANVKIHVCAINNSTLLKLHDFPAVVYTGNLMLYHRDLLLQLRYESRNNYSKHHPGLLFGFVNPDNETEFRTVICGIIQIFIVCLIWIERG